jgi:ATP-binding cassette, subfamily B, bacterial
MTDNSKQIMRFKDVTFGYDEGKPVLNKVNFELFEGKTYALVGPTGGGKSTTASIMARLYDPVSGSVEFKNKDIKCYTPAQLSKSIGFILQEPFLFSGSVGDNLRYGNEEIAHLEDKDLNQMLTDLELNRLVEMFEKGLQTEVSDNSENISLGQKQLISFMRTMLRSPEFLILDEATANIDTVTESLLEEIINKLPHTTTKVVIAHRLSTIKDADQIFFINNGVVQSAASFDEAINLIEGVKRGS